MSYVPRSAYDNVVIVTRDVDGTDTAWAGSVKNLIYDAGTMAWIAQTATAASGGAGDASAANQTTEITKLTSIDGKTPALGQALMAASVPVAIASNQGAIPVSGTFWQATQPVSGTFWQTTQPVSIASMPSTPVTGTFWQATQPVSGPLTDTQLRASAVPVSGTFWQATQPVSGTVAATQSGTWTVTQQAITKATQGSTGVTTQDLKDAGRSARTISLDSFAVAATTETLNTMSYSTDNGTATTGTSYAVTTAKRLRVQAITASLHTIAGNTTAANVIVRIRVNNGGAALVSSPIQMVFALPGVAAALSASTPVTIPIPDGWEFVAGAGIGVTTTCAGFVATTAAPKVNITITGYEY